MGQVREPGSYPLSGGMTVIEALARAGSTTADAAPEALIVRAKGRNRAQATLPGNGDAADVTRVDVNDVQSGALASQVTLADGDTVFVPRAETVFVTGHVRSPGAYPIGKTTTVLQALTLAGGVSERGAANRVRVLRTEKGARVQVKVKLHDVLRAGDTVVVPERFF